jgi:hypothetical protein
MADTVFISPGVFTREFDGTVRPADSVGVGAVIISPRDKGPAMEPVLVKDRDTDQLKFGLPNVNGRDFGAYAARAYLDVQSNPLTQVRLLGLDDTGIVPGFNIGSAGGLFAIGASGSNVVALIVASGAVALGGATTSSVENLAISIPGWQDVTASLNRSSAKYIRRVLNTDPTQFSTYKHFVYATYDYTSKTPTSNNAFFSTKVAGANNWQDAFITGSTNVIISQPFGLIEYDLFGIGNRFAGDSANREWKVTFANIKKSPNPDVNEFGTFSLLVRRFDDNDKNPIVLESYTNLSLNPDADNYVARVIGDSYRVWNKATKKFDEFGEYENKSQFIFINPSLDLKNKNVPGTALPYGFKGYQSVTTGSFSNKARLPDMPMVANMTYKSDFNTRVCWGVAVIDNASGSINYGMPDRSKHLPKALTSVSGAVGSSFSLKWVSASVGLVSGFSDATRLTDVQISQLSTSIAFSSAAGTPTTSGSSGFSGYLSLENIENTALAKFTVVPADGFDGTDLTKVNPFDPANMTSVSTYEVYAYRAALDMISNPDELEMTDIALPGVYAPKVTDYAIEMVENRGDTFYIMDITGSTINDAINDIVAKNVDTNYAATYYPWLTLDDKVNRKQVSVPPTVVMPAVFAFSDRVSFAWYAPAGFTRGGLKDRGVLKAKDKLNKTDRDRLQENRINPIATFGSEGVVVWGQKTLQKAASALDRINVRRMMLKVRKEIAKIALTTVFEPNVASTWQSFINKAEPRLDFVKRNFGINDFKLILDESTTTEDLIERNIIYGKMMIVPTRSAEAFYMDFFLTNNGAGFSE